MTLNDLKCHFNRNAAVNGRPSSIQSVRYAAEPPERLITTWDQRTISPKLLLAFTGCSASQSGSNTTSLYWRTKFYPEVPNKPSYYAVVIEVAHVQENCRQQLRTGTRNLRKFRASNIWCKFTTNMANNNDDTDEWRRQPTQTSNQTFKFWSRACEFLNLEWNTSAFYSVEEMHQKASHMLKELVGSQVDKFFVHFSLACVTPISRLW